MEWTSEMSNYHLNQMSTSQQQQQQQQHSINWLNNLSISSSLSSAVAPSSTSSSLSSSLTNINNESNLPIWGRRRGCDHRFNYSGGANQNLNPNQSQSQNNFSSPSWALATMNFTNLGVETDVKPGEFVLRTLF